jgi:glucose-1-phosphate cytidylyltransferase
MTIEPEATPVVILCGGKGTRIREASESLPKPMIDVGGKPMVWHIMKLYHHFGFRKFVLCLGYKSSAFKEYFLRYRENATDFTLRFSSDDPIEFHGSYGIEDWEVTCAYTGLDTLTAGRLSRVRSHVADAEHFALTYGDGLADIDLATLLAVHEREARIGTVTAVRPTSRFGELDTEGTRVTSLAEKPQLNEGLVNGGFFLFRRDFLDHVADDDGMLESTALQDLTERNELSCHVHTGFWRGMDTYREFAELNAMWDEKRAPWRLWD